ncbi:hypothetical protein [Halegenticoccus soli]|uniref:hypothetical protein n=1 Tax=Halegenticoccus soli TaxID=1985678 RepID=UPI0018EB88E9|nr:hypothetical protein [Halegenticoccus soli]
MSVLTWMIDAVAEEKRDGLVHECRECGTTLRPVDEQCPQCGSVEISHYDVS